MHLLNLVWEPSYVVVEIGGPSKMTFGTSNLLVFFVAEGDTIIKGVLDSTRPGLHNGLRKIKKKIQPSL